MQERSNNRGATIFAEATPPGRGAVAIIKVSGPDAHRAIEAFGATVPAPRQAALRRLRSGDEVLDEALTLWFPGPNSYTGEDLVEFHLHGGQAVISDVSRVLAALPGYRVAGPGEFTRRAVESGRLDLAMAEAVGDLVDAETSAQRRQALDQLSGGLSGQIWGWRERLVECRALLEATIDFSDEEIPSGLYEDVDRRVAELIAELKSALTDARRGELVRRGVRIAVVGPANAGKSSFLNWLGDRNIAIVSPIPGTTRDVLECSLDIDGVRVVIADTAGLRMTSDPIEAEGVRRARQWIESADATILIIDGSQERPPAALLGEFDAALLIANKADLARSAWVPEMAMALSLTRDIGRSVVLNALSELVRGLVGTPKSSGVMTRERHRRAAETALSALHAFRDGRETELPVEIQAEQLRHAAQAVGGVTGAVDVETVLDRIFASFCIGK